MKQIKWKLASLFLAACTSLAVSGVVAQENPSAGSSSAATQPQNDEQFVEKSIRDSKTEIEMAEMALEKSQNDNIKQAAQILITDHKAMIADLSKLNGTDVLDEYESNTDQKNTDATDKEQDADGNSDAENSAVNGNNDAKPGVTENNSNDAANTPPSAAGDTGTSSNQLDIAGTKTTKDEDAQQTQDGTTGVQPGVTDHKTMLENATGAEFDNMWVNHMLVQHKIKLGELHQANKTVKNSEVQEFVKEAIPEIREHRDMLEKLKENPDAPITAKKTNKLRR